MLNQILKFEINIMIKFNFYGKIIYYNIGRGCHMTRDEALKQPKAKMVLKIKRNVKNSNEINSYVLKEMNEDIPNSIFEISDGIFVGDDDNEDTVGILAMAACDIKEKLLKMDYLKDVLSFNLYNNNNVLIDDFILNG